MKQYYLEVELLKDENEVKDILQRIGIQTNGKVYQSCYLTKNKNETKYFIVHFKELFSYYEFINEDHINYNKIKMVDQDFFRRNNIINYLYEQGIIKPINSSYIEKNLNPEIDFFVVPEEDKEKYLFVSKFKI